MNEAQRAHFRQILLAWRQELMEEADRTMHHLQDEVANLPDPAAADAGTAGPEPLLKRTKVLEEAVEEKAKLKEISLQETVQREKQTQK